LYDEPHVLLYQKLTLPIQDRLTSVALEAGIWDCLADMRRREELSLDGLCDEIVSQSDGISMASAIELCALEYFREIHGGCLSARSVV
jgi:predicted DNA-binding ribbon-helix-helix protein